MGPRRHPTHSYLRTLYRYAHAAFPYDELRELARNAGPHDRELADTGVLAEDRFFDITATNHGLEPRPLHLLPQLWFRNTWSWGRDERRAE